MNWLGDNMWAAWLALAVALAGAELLTLDLILIMLATGATAGMLTSFATDSVVAQVLVALGVAVGMLAVVRPSLARRMQGGPELALGNATLIGYRTVTLQAISGTAPGQIKINGEVWTAKPYDDTLIIEPGRTVEVLEIRGATAYVHPLPELED